MPKAHSPVRLEASLMESAALAGELFKRSAAQQVELWASIGKIVDQKITPNDLIELIAGLAELRIERSAPVTIDSTGLVAEIDQKQQSGSLQKTISNNRLRYQASQNRPGSLERVEPDGTVTIGQFKNGKFKAI